MTVEGGGAPLRDPSSRDNLALTKLDVIRTNRCKERHAILNDRNKKNHFTNRQAKGWTIHQFYCWEQHYVSKNQRVGFSLIQISSTDELRPSLFQLHKFNVSPCLNYIHYLIIFSEIHKVGSIIGSLILWLFAKELKHNTDPYQLESPDGSQRCAAPHMVMGSNPRQCLSTHDLQVCWLKKTRLPCRQSAGIAPEVNMRITTGEKAHKHTSKNSKRSFQQSFLLGHKLNDNRCSVLCGGLSCGSSCTINPGIPDKGLTHWEAL